MESIAIHTSEQEVKAADAERASRKFKQVEYMSERVGQTFDGIISGVTEWGLYIEEKETRCEGMARIKDLGDDFFRFDRPNFALVGDRTKKRYRLGDPIKFKVMNADLDRKTLDYKVVS
jgi:ribonuclease R